MHLWTYLIIFSNLEKKLPLVNECIVHLEGLCEQYRSLPPLRRVLPSGQETLVVQAEETIRRYYTSASSAELPQGDVFAEMDMYMKGNKAVKAQFDRDKKMAGELVNNLASHAQAKGLVAAAKWGKKIGLSSEDAEELANEGFNALMEAANGNPNAGGGLELVVERVFIAHAKEWTARADISEETADEMLPKVVVLLKTALTEHRVDTEKLNKLAKETAIKEATLRAHEQFPKLPEAVVAFGAGAFVKVMQKQVQVARVE